MTQTVFTAEMNPLRLAGRIGKGGEGEVYALAGGSDEVAKLYTVTNTSSREAKIKTMIDAGLAQTTPLIAFPLALIRDQSGAFAGFTMKKISGHQPLHELYAPGVRKAAFPKADYRFLVRTATNIARAVGSVHDNRCVIGDINHSGFLISNQAKVALIDADSFQIMDGAVRYACKVGTPEYTPPELQGRSLDGVVRTQNHDAFGLAVVIFQLLWMGRHPFSGKFVGGEMPLERAIAEFRFAYSVRTTGMDPPPAVPHLSDFPGSVAAALEQSFGPQGVSERPSAKQWIALLQSLEGCLTKCAKNTLHYHPPEALVCPWCGMERKFGVQLFLPALPSLAHSAAFAPMSSDIAAIWRAIEAVQRPLNENPSLKVSGAQLTAPSPEAKAVASSRLYRKILGTTLLGIAAILVVVFPAYLILALIPAGVGLNRLWVKPESSRNFERRYREIEMRWLEAERSWKSRAGPRAFEVLRDGLTSLKKEFDDLAADEARRIREYEANRRSDQLRAYLEGFHIRRTKIANVGPAKQAALTSYGIETAADVSPVAVENVPGFGKVNSQPLMDWRLKLELGFFYNASSTQADALAVDTIRMEIRARATQIKAELGTGPERLRKLAQAITEIQSSIDPTLQLLSDGRAQALADLRCLGIPPSTVTLPVATPIGAMARQAPLTQSNQSPQCPRCGSVMISRTAKRGRNSGGRFLGCTRYPICKGTRPIP